MTSYITIERHFLKASNWREFLALREAQGSARIEKLKPESIIEISNICCCHNSISDVCYNQWHPS